MNRVEVCLSPLLFDTISVNKSCIAVVVDVLRATTSFCAAFQSGVKSIRPVAQLSEARWLQSQGFLVAAEREGEKVDFADFGNSPVHFLKSILRGLDLVYTTTNGTQAIEMAKKCSKMATACFSNLEAAAKWLHAQNSDVVIMCAGWKNSFSIEDTLCAGALVKLLEETDLFTHSDDATEAALSLWALASTNNLNIARQSSHYRRLENLDQFDDLEFCFRIDVSRIVPVWDGTRLLPEIW